MIMCISNWWIIISVFLVKYLIIIWLSIIMPGYSEHWGTGLILSGIILAVFIFLLKVDISQENHLI